MQVLMELILPINSRYFSFSSLKYKNQIVLNKNPPSKYVYRKIGNNYSVISMSYYFSEAQNTILFTMLNH